MGQILSSSRHKYKLVSTKSQAKANLFLRYDVATDKYSIATTTDSCPTQTSMDQCDFFLAQGTGKTLEKAARNAILVFANDMLQRNAAGDTLGSPHQPRVDIAPCS